MCLVIIEVSAPKAEWNVFIMRDVERIPLKTPKLFQWSLISIGSIYSVVVSNCMVKSILIVRKLHLFYARKPMIMPRVICVNFNMSSASVQSSKRRVNANLYEQSLGKRRRLIRNCIHTDTSSKRRVNANIHVFEQPLGKRNKTCWKIYAYWQIVLKASQCK